MTELKKEIKIDENETKNIMIENVAEPILLTLSFAEEPAEFKASDGLNFLNGKDSQTTAPDPLPRTDGKMIDISFPLDTISLKNDLGFLDGHSYGESNESSVLNWGSRRKYLVSDNHEIIEKPIVSKENYGYYKKIISEFLQTEDKYDFKELESKIIGDSSPAGIHILSFCKWAIDPGSNFLELEERAFLKGSWLSAFVLARNIENGWYSPRVITEREIYERIVNVIYSTEDFDIAIATCAKRLYKDGKIDYAAYSKASGQLGDDESRRETIKIGSVEFSQYTLGKKIFADLKRAIKYCQKNISNGIEDHEFGKVKFSISNYKYVSLAVTTEIRLILSEEDIDKAVRNIDLANDKIIDDIFWDMKVE